MVLFPIIFFQFHYGSIKTEFAKLYQKGADTFNSIMVRLKPLAFEMVRNKIAPFNSIMVRLKLNSVVPLVKIYVLSIPLWFD